MSSAELKHLKHLLDHREVSDYYGLKNQGATCYLNSVLQVLFMTLDFREAVERSSGENSKTIDAELKRLFTVLKTSTADTRDVTRKLRIKNTYEQCDAAEYFEKILRLSSPDSSKVFKGQLRHRTTCSKCRRWSDLEGLFWTLPLSMGDSPHQTFRVESGFEAFFKLSEVSGDNKLFCNSCGIKADWTIECEIMHHPDVLTLLLKRFQFDYERRCYVKLNCVVEVPQTLQTAECTYCLYAIVDHHGSLKAGHYTAVIKSHEVGAWYLYNDSVVSKFTIPEGIIRSNRAYLLMYRKAKPQSLECMQPTQVDDEGKDSTLPNLHMDGAILNAKPDITGLKGPHKTEVYEKAKLDIIINTTIKKMNNNLEQSMKTPIHEDHIYLKTDQKMSETKRFHNGSLSKDTTETLGALQRPVGSNSLKLSRREKAHLEPGTNIRTGSMREKKNDKERDPQRSAWK